MTRRHPLRPVPPRSTKARGGLTLVEMLVAMAITLLIMAAVVTVFANISGSVTRRRATIEMASTLRNVREALARDLAGATCPAVPWREPESNVGYLEVIEGPQNDYYPSPWLWCSPTDTTNQTINGVSVAVQVPDTTTGLITEPIGSLPGIDLEVSTLPGSNLRHAGVPADDEGGGLAIGSNAALPETVKTDGRGLGDADDTLMLTVRNEKEPFLGRIPKRRANDGSTSAVAVSDPASRPFAQWDQAGGNYSGGAEEIESQLAEVVWYALENPVDPNRTFAFGEPGYRTIYRRALLILPELDYRIDVIAGGVDFNPASVAGRLAGPGVVRVLGPAIGRGRADWALASLIAFQDRYDLSVRLEWDPLLPDSTSSASDPPGRWVIRANTLGDLTKRENRYEHHGFVPLPINVDFRQTGQDDSPGRYFPFAVASGGVQTSGPTTLPVVLAPDPELLPGVTPADNYQAFVPAGADYVVSYQPTGASGGVYPARPFAYVNDRADWPATARAIVDEDGAIVHVTSGLAPLGGSRRGDDVMMTDALAFDLRVYDPGAPRYAYYPGGATPPGVANDPPDQIFTPGDPGWASAFYQDTRNSPLGDGATPLLFQGQGAYVDLAYGLSYLDPSRDPSRLLSRYGRTPLPDVWAAAEVAGFAEANFQSDGLIRLAVGPNTVANRLPITKRYATYDTWSRHYETNGLNEDGDQPSGDLMGAARETPAIDEGTNGLDDPTWYPNVNGGPGLATRLGADDPAERETRPPYDTALRGLQVTLRVYERDSRQIREVRVRESFVPE